MTLRSATTVLAVTLLSACAPRATINPAGEQQTLATSQAEITPLFNEMYAAANAHDTDRHLAVYAHTASLLFIVNDEPIQGWNALHEKQLGWWQDGKSDVAYQLAAPPAYNLIDGGMVVQRYTLLSRRNAPDGTAREGRISVTALWQKRAEGWRVIYANESVGSK